MYILIQVSHSPLANQDVFFYSKPPAARENKRPRLEQISRISLDRPNDPGLDRQNLEHSMERQNLMIQVREDKGYMERMFIHNIH